MFSYEEKRKIAAAVKSVIREIDHPEMDNGDIRFDLHIYGREPWSFANITQNMPEHKPDNPWNEKAREIMGRREETHG